MVSEQAIVLESNIDDMNPEHYDFILEKLFEAGASDVWLVPVIMKKSRPGVTFCVLCKEEMAGKMKEIIFTHSSSIGIREYRVKKDMLRRAESEIETIYGSIRIKQSFFKDRVVRTKPEFEDCKKLADLHQITLSEIEKEVTRIVGNKLM